MKFRPFKKPKVTTSCCRSAYKQIFGWKEGLGLTVLFFLLLNSRVGAQPLFSTKTFTTDNGLCHNFVKHVSQDSTGFLWISTWDGLSRYDGHEFRNYYHKPGDESTFPFFIVHKTLVDKMNNVWVLCPERALVVYNRAKDNFERFRPNGMDEFIAGSITSDAQGNVWLLNLHQNLLYCLHPETMKMDTFQMEYNGETEQLWDTTLPNIVFDNHSNIWFFRFWGDRYHILKGSPNKGSVIRFHEFEPLSSSYFETPYDIKTPAVFDVHCTEAGSTWLFSTFGIFQMPAGSESFEKRTSLNSLEEITGKPHFFWSDDETGINVLDTKTQEILHIGTEKEKYVGCIFVDSENTIWNGESAETHDHIGLNRTIRAPRIFNHYLTEKNEFGNDHLVFPILKDKNKDIWAGTRGLDYLFKIKPNGEVHKTKFIPSFKGESNPKVRTMVEDSAGIWMGCTEDVLLNYDFATGEFTRFDFKRDGSNLHIHNILETEGNLIVNGLDALFTYQIGSGIVSANYESAEMPKFCMVGDGEKGFWAGSSNSTIFHFDDQFNTIGQYQIGTGNTNVEHICPGDNNDVWVALMGGGLGHLFPGTGEVEIFTSADGLSNNTTYSILKDKKGKLWISTNKGISRFNPSTKHFKNYGKAEGLMIEEFNSDAFYLSTDGEMFFGGVGGMVSFYPDSLENNPAVGNNPGRLLITEFNVSGEPRYLKKPVYECDTVTLNNGDNNFQLTFACINFTHADKIYYRHRLSGNNMGWIENDYRHRTINYANLLPGNYKLEIESSNSSGEWVAAVSLLVKIPQFYYQTLWFKWIVALFILLVISAIIVVYNRQMTLAAQQKQDVLKLESLRGQMNPHFIFNSLNSINYFISNNDKVSANHYIADFSRLIRAFLNNLSSDYISFEKELETLDDYLKLEHLRFGDKFDYVLLADKVKDHENTKIFPGMVQPFIENAIWHGIRGLENRKGFIKIEFIPINSKKIRCTIEDDGIGRKQAQQFSNKLPGKESRGIGIVLERLRIINTILRIDYDVVIEDLRPGAKEPGTLVMIDLPSK